MRLQALKNVDSAATAVIGEAGNVLDAHLGSSGGVRGRGALSNALGAVAAGLEDVTAAELAAQVRGLDVSSVALDRDTVVGNHNSGKSSNKEGDRLVHC